MSQSLQPKIDFENVRGPRNSAYAVNLTYDRHTDIYNWVSEASPTLGCSIEISRDMYRLLHAFECNMDIIPRVNGEVIS